uniref:V-SNARE coiled-coil homology domain-containing protein n=1 Tax=Amphiprion percula TaxID=161767 RepID=A0A3P8RZ53_AMPPE
FFLKNKKNPMSRVLVVDIMRVNVDNVLERDQKLSELDDRADALQAGASQFESSKNCKVCLISILFSLITFLILVFSNHIKVNISFNISVYK